MIEQDLKQILTKLDALQSSVDALRSGADGERDGWLHIREGGRWVPIYEISHSVIQRRLERVDCGNGYDLPLCRDLQSLITFTGRGSMRMPIGRQVLLLAISQHFRIEAQCVVVRQLMEQQYPRLPVGDYISTIEVSPIDGYTITERRAQP